jgi:hypothetical protein
MADGWRIRHGRMLLRVQPHGLSVFRVATPPGLVGIGASRQLGIDGARNFGKGHLDAQAAVPAKLSFQALILLTSHRDNLLLATGLEPDKGSVALEHIRIVPRAGMNLLRLYWPAVAHSVETAPVYLGG